MNQKKQLTIMEFSRLTGIKRENLRYYDRIGLLCPDERGENSYRYYSRHQLNTAYLITSLRTIGVSIDEIKKYTTFHTTQDTLALFQQQDQQIKKEIQQLKEIQKILQSYSHMIANVLLHEEKVLFVEEKEHESIFLCPLIPKGMDDDEAEIMSYAYAKQQGIHVGYPIGTMIAKEFVENAQLNYAKRYYFKTSKNTKDRKPAGLYAVIYDNSISWENKPIYLKLLDFIEEQNLEIIGDAYEEYPMSQSDLQGVMKYCVRIEVPVKHKKKLKSKSLISILL